MKVIKYIICLFLIVGNKLTAQVVVKDSLFLNYLISNYPSTVDVTNKSIKVTQAGAVTGAMVCNDCGFKSIEGIQCFTSISGIYFSGNEIDSMPDLPNLRNIQVLDISKNRLKALPNLDQMTKLSQLVAYENQLTVLPSLDANVKLIYLDVVDNQLKSLPNLSKLTSMQKLLCDKNELVRLPVLDSLVELQALDASYNKIDTFPNIFNNRKLKTLHLNDNLLSDLPSLPQLPSIQKIFLYDNQLTFEDLYQLSSYPNYSSIFVVSPQTYPSTTQYINVLREDSLAVYSNIDLQVPDMKYDWYRNGLIVSSSVNNGFLIPKTSFADSGNYICILRNDNFPWMQIVADTFKVSISECVDTNSLKIVTSPITCDLSGKVDITSPNKTYHYELKGLLSGQINNTLFGLEEERYSLKVFTKKGCSVEMKRTIEIPRTDCGHVLITPNGDGESDKYFFEEKGTVKIFNKQGTMVKKVNIPDYWDGNSDQGKLPQGIYIADINNGQKLLKISIWY